MLEVKYLKTAAKASEIQRAVEQAHEQLTRYASDAARRAPDPGQGDEGRSAGVRGRERRAVPPVAPAPRDGPETAEEAREEGREEAPGKEGGEAQGLVGQRVRRYSITAFLSSADSPSPRFSSRWSITVLEVVVAAVVEEYDLIPIRPPGWVP